MGHVRTHGVTVFSYTATHVGTYIHTSYMWASEARCRAKTNPVTPRRARRAPSPGKDRQRLFNVPWRWSVFKNDAKFDLKWVCHSLGPHADAHGLQISA